MLILGLKRVSIDSKGTGVSGRVMEASILQNMRHEREVI